MPNVVGGQGQPASCTRRSATLKRSALLAFAVLCLDARAKDADEPTTGLEEIVVTATKNGDVSAQSAPFSVQAFGEEEMERAKIQGFNDYSKLVAGLATLNRGPDQTQIIIRGITAGRVSHAEPQNQSTSGLYVDELPIATNGFNPDLDLFDVNRIEVLKGPQGTLFGAGAESGAIRIITNEVNLQKVSGAVSADGAKIYAGSADYSAHAMINAPLIDDVLGIRASAFYDHQGGYIKNVYTGQSDYNGYSTSGGRIKALWKINDSLDVRANVIYQHLIADGRPQVFLPGDPTVTAFNAPTEHFGSVVGQYQTVKFLPDPFDDTFTLANLLVEYSWNSLHFVSSTSMLKREFDNTLDDTYRLRLHFGPTNVDGNPFDVAFINDSNLNDISQEFRLNQKLDNGFEWVGGVYFERHNIHFVQSAVAPGLDALSVSFGLPPAAGFGAQPNSEFDGNEDDHQVQYAAFGEVTVPLAEKWRLIVGERVFNYHQTSMINYAGIANDGAVSKDGSVNETGSTPKGELTFQPTADATLYMQAAKGFRLGGVTDPVPLAGVFGTDCAKDLAAVGLTAIQNKFDSDHLWSYELGAKTRWMDRRLTANVAVFDIEWSNIQTNVFLPCGYINVVNAGKARSRGGEAEVNWAVLPVLTLGVTASYTDATLVEKTLAFDANVGDRVPNVPKFTGNVSAEYRTPLDAADRAFFARAVVSYLGSSYTEFQSLTNARLVPASADVDASIGLSIREWDFSVYGKNLTNRFIVTGVDTDRNVPETYSVAPPRTVGLEARLRF
jgi:iron complex outermembrane receptor protein